MKKTSFYLPFITLFFFTQLLVAQIHVDDNGSVGIGTDTPGSSTKLKITTDGLSNSQDNKILYVNYTGSTASRNHYGIYTDIVPSTYGYGYGGYFKGGRVGIQTQAMETGSGYRYGLITYAYNGGTQNRAIHAVGNGGSGTTNYGVHSRALGNSNYNCALYGEASGATTEENWAGVFNGRVSMTYSIEYSSDEKLKENFGDIENALDKIKKIKSKTYKFKKDKNLQLSKEKQYGFVAQELAEVFPELVSEITMYATNDPELKEESEINTGKTTTTHKTIKYIQLIPILVQGLQDQQEVIEDLQRNQEDMLKRIEQLEK